jgi:hypothetical protein
MHTVVNNVFQHSELPVSWLKHHPLDDDGVSIRQLSGDAATRVDNDFLGDCLTAA